METRKILAIITWVIILVVFAHLYTYSSAKTDTTSNCVLLTYHRNMICEYNSSFTNYTAGEGDIVLAGNLIPRDNRWNNNYFQLSGHLVNNGSCTMLIVETAIKCSVDVAK